MKIRIQFAKYGKMIYIGHLDIMRYFQKALRRADVDLVYTQGFHPHPVLSFAAPLGVGITSCGEYADLEVHSTASTPEMLMRLNQAMVPGMKVLEYRLLPEDAKNAMSIVAAADYCLCFRDWNRFAETASVTITDYLKGLQQFLEKDSIVVEKKTKKGSRMVDIRPLVYDFCLKEESETGDGPAMFFQVSTGSTDNLKPELIINAYHAEAGYPWIDSMITICRLETYTQESLPDESRKLIPLRELGSVIETAISEQDENK